MNSEEVLRQPSNPSIPINDLGSNPGPEHMPLQRCEGDCDNDDHCSDGLYCMQNNGYEELPSCEGTQRRSRDYCVDINDFQHGFVLTPTGGWDDDWGYSNTLDVTLAGK